MSQVNNIRPQSAQSLPRPQKVGGDADGDNDGTKASQAPTSAPLPKPTATMGNHVNVRA
jgi:hypothetical protein